MASTVVDRSVVSNAFEQPWMIRRNLERLLPDHVPFYACGITANFGTGAHLKKASVVYVVVR